jgi:hypothetical protein
MKTLHSKRVWLPLAILFMSFVQTSAQLLNDKFISPNVFRQGQASVIKATWGDYLYVAGNFDFHGDRQLTNQHIVKLRPDGLLDTSFNPQIPGALSAEIEDMEILTTNNVAFIAPEPATSEKRVVILGPTGNWLATVYEAADITALEPDGQGGFYVGTAAGVIKYYNRNISPQYTVTHVNGRINDIQWQDEMITVAGEFSSAWDNVERVYHARKLLVRFTRIGAVDKTFNANAVMQPYSSIGGILLQSDGKTVPLKKYHFIPNHPPAIRLNKDGSRDMNFVSPFPAAIPFQDAFLVFGNLTVITDTRIVRLHYNGAINQSFDAIRYPQARVVAAGLTDGSLVAGNYQPATYGFGKFTSTGVRVNEYYARLARYGEIYSIDRTSTSMWIAGDFVRVGNHFTRNVARLNLDGTVLAKFRSSIITPVQKVEAFDNARALVQTANRLYRLESDGIIDPSLVYPAIPELTTLYKFIVQPDGKIILGGNLRLFRLNANGSRDNTFNGDVGKDAVGGAGMDFDLDRSTGKIIYANWQSGGGVEKTELIRLNPNGSRDGSFNAPEFPENSFLFYSQVLALDNQEVLLMKSTFLIEDHSYDIVKLNADGSINFDFMNNLNSELIFYEHAARFGQRIIVYKNRLSAEDEDTAYGAAWLNGVPDRAFTIGVSTKVIHALYSDNSTELFVAGHLVSNGRRYAIVKVTYPPTPAVADAAEADTAELRFYPNPVADRLTVEVDAPGTVNIFDRTGFRKLSVPVDQTTNTIDLHELHPGSYVIEVTTQESSYRDHLVKR